MYAGVLKFCIWIPHEKIDDTYFLLGLCPFPELWPFEKIWKESCQNIIAKIGEAKALKF